MGNFKKLPLAMAVVSVAMASSPALAETETQTQQLETIKVKGDRQGLKVKTDVVNTRKKDESVETDLRGLFKSEPAINIGGGNGTSQFLYIRGMGQNSIDVHVDNAYSDSQIHYHQGRHMLDPALVKIVSVQKGAGSASAGIGQTNGAVIAKTLDAKDLLKNSSNPNFGAKINAGFSSNKGHHYGVSAFGQYNNMFDFLISGNRVDESNYRGGKGYTNTFNTNRVPYTSLDKTSYLLKFGANLDKHRLVLSHLNEQHSGQRLVREEFLADPDGTPNSRLTVARQAPADRKMSVTNTNLEWTASDLGFVQNANANIYRLVHGRWSADDSGNGYAGGNRNNGATKTQVETIGANVNLDSQVHDKVLLKYGVNLRNQKVKPNQIFNANVVNQQKQDVGLYAEAITDITDKVTLTTGLRYDRFSFKAMDGKKHNDGAINPSLGVIFQATPELSFSASHNYATRSPRMHDALMAHGGRGIVSIASNTKAEQARNTEVGFNYNNGTFGVEGSYFYQNIKDALGTSTGRNNHLCPAPTANNRNECYSEIINAGTIKNKGYELSTSFRKSGFVARVGVAHSKPRFYGDRLSTNPEYASAIGRAWTASVSYRFDKPNLEIGLNHQQYEKVKAADNFFKVGGTPPTTGKAGYGVTDVYANWKPFGNDKMNVNFAINNLTNKLYYAHAQRGAFAGVGREYRLGVNYNF